MPRLAESIAKFRTLDTDELSTFFEAWRVLLGWKVRLLTARWVPGLGLSDRLFEGSNGRMAEAAELQLVADAVLRAQRYHLVRSNCLPRALTITSLLRRRGLPAEIVLGVRRGPGEALQAHAWVRSGNQTVGDRESVVASYTAMAKQSDRKPVLLQLTP